MSNSSKEPWEDRWPGWAAGSGEVVVNGEATPVTAGDAVFIPGDAEHVAVNTGDVPLRLLYVFATDSFADVVYRFPGAAEPS